MKRYRQVEWYKLHKGGKRKQKHLDKEQNSKYYKCLQKTLKNKMPKILKWQQANATKKTDIQAAKAAAHNVRWTFKGSKAKTAFIVTRSSTLTSPQV